MILIHTIVSILLALIIYFFDFKFAQIFLIASATFNVYLRLLQFHLGSILSKQTPNSLGVLISALRIILTGAVLGFLLIKSQSNIFPISLAFIVYKIVLLRSARN